MSAARLASDAVTIAPATARQRKEARTRWLRTLVPGRPFPPGPAVFFGLGRLAGWAVLLAAQALVDRLLERETTKVLAAELSAVPGETVGFVAFDGNEVHMVHVLGPDQPKGARRLGIATLLLSAARDAAGADTMVCTALTRDGRRLAASIPWLVTA